MVKKLEHMWLLCIPILVVMILCSDFFYKYWIGDSVSIPLSLSISMALYVLFQTMGNVYMYLINGTSRVRLQLIVYLLIAIIARDSDCSCNNTRSTSFGRQNTDNENFKKYS